VTVATARIYHAVTSLVAVLGLTLAIVLVIRGGQVLDEVEPPALGLRLARFIAYFTVQSNLLVAVTCAQLARDPLRDGPSWRPLRLAAVVGITVTGLVHLVLLRPLIDLHGADLLADTVVHVVVPLLAVIGWALYGPRPRVRLRDVGLALCWPLAWLAVMLVVGALTGWYPYPFLDHREEHGVLGVVLSIAAITALFLLLLGLGRLVDRRAGPAPRALNPYSGGVVRS
jgi:hypothetical protein